MIQNPKSSVSSPGSPQSSTTQSSNKPTATFLNQKTVKTLLDSQMCLRCYKKDPMIFPGSSFKLCISCDIENIKRTQGKTVNELIALGICPKCHNEDPMLFKGSSFRTCVPCDMAENLYIAPQDNK